MNKNNKAFINGAIWLTVSTILLKVIGVIYKIPISYILGDEGMGIFNSAYTVYTLFYIIGSSGIPRAISILVSKYEADSPNSSYPIYKTAFAFLSTIGLFLSALLFFLAKHLSYFVGNESAWLSLVAISPTVFFVSASGVLRGYFSGRMNFAPIAISELIAASGKLVFGLIFAYWGVKENFSLPMTCAFSILGMTVGSFFGMLYLYVFHKRRYKHECNFTYNIGYIREIVKLAFPLTLAAALSSAVNLLDLSMIMNGLSAAGYSSVIATVLYGNYTTLTVPMIALVSALIAPITTSMQPVLSKNFARNDVKEIASDLKTCYRSVAFITIPVALAFFVLSGDILSVLFEREAAVLGAPTLSLVSPALFFLGAATVINTSLEANGKTVVPMLSLAGGAFAKLFIGVTLLKFTDLGILTAPIGTAASYFVCFLISYSHYRLSEQKLPTPFFGIAAPLLISCISLVLAVLIKSYFGLYGVTRLQNILVVALYGAFYLMCSLIFYKKRINLKNKYSNMHKKI